MWKAIPKPQGDVKCAYCGKPFDVTNKDWEGLWDKKYYVYQLQEDLLCNKLCCKAWEQKLMQEGKLLPPDSGKMLSRVVVNSDEWINGTWDDLGPEPVKITGGKKQLIEECRKRGLMAKALIKPKHTGKGYEMR